MKIIERFSMTNNFWLSTALFIALTELAFNNTNHLKYTTMFGFAFLPFIIFLFYLTILGVVFFLIYTWVNKFISLKQEQNDLLKEIIKKLDNKSTKRTEE